MQRLIRLLLFPRLHWMLCCSLLP